MKYTGYTEHYTITLSGIYRGINLFFPTFLNDEKSPNYNEGKTPRK